MGNEWCVRSMSLEGQSIDPWYCCKDIAYCCKDIAYCCKDIADCCRDTWPMDEATSSPT